MPFSRIAFLSLALAALSAESSRLKTKPMQSKGPHKCTITWPGRGNGKPATASFGVSSCIIKCKLTNGDLRPEKVYPSGFEAVQNKKTCACQTTEGRELFKFEGSCGDEASAKSKCFETYTRMMTDEYKAEYGRETLAVFHNPKLYGDQTYDYTTCEQDGCDGDECTEHYLPSLWDSRDGKEKKLLAELIKKAATEGSKDLTTQQKDLLRSLRGRFPEVLPDGADAGPMQEDDASTLAIRRGQLHAFLNEISKKNQPKPIERVSNQWYMNALDLALYGGTGFTPRLLKACASRVFSKPQISQLLEAVNIIYPAPSHILGTPTLP